MDPKVDAAENTATSSAVGGAGFFQNLSSFSLRESFYGIPHGGPWNCRTVLEQVAFETDGIRFAASRSSQPLPLEKLPLLHGGTPVGGLSKRGASAFRKLPGGIQGTLYLFQTLVDNLLESNSDGLYCAAGDFYVDPWNPVSRAVITHAHSDHLCPGSKTYLTVRAGERLLRTRLDADATIESVDYGSTVEMNGVHVSFHPAGHILGSAQVRIEQHGQIWVVSGDYKLAPEPTCAPFEPVRCHTFITESTFGLPIFQWPDQSAAFGEINAWWRGNQQAGKASVLYAYPLGKAQRVLAGVDPSIGPIFTHGLVETFNAIYRDTNIPLAATEYVRSAPAKTDWTLALILAPPMGKTSPWLRRFGDFSTGSASGWMRIRGTRRRQSIDRGFVLSDHADWPALLSAIRDCGAAQVWVTHGYRAAMARWLGENGLHAEAIETQFEGERDEPTDTAAAESEP